MKSDGFLSRVSSHLADSYTQQTPRESHSCNYWIQDIFLSLNRSQGIAVVCLETCFSQVFAMLGTYLSIVHARRYGLKASLIHGFSTQVGAFLLLALAIFARVNKYGCYGLYCLVSLSLAFGPNVATYILPTVCYETKVRSTFHGRSAALGKLGAFMGALLFPVLADRIGLGSLMVFMSGVAACGVAVSVVFVGDV